MAADGSTAVTSRSSGSYDPAPAPTLTTDRASPSAAWTYAAPRGIPAAAGLVVEVAGHPDGQPDSAVFLIAASVAGIPVRAFSIRSAIWAGASAPTYRGTGRCRRAGTPRTPSPSSRRPPG